MVTLTSSCYIRYWFHEYTIGVELLKFNVIVGSDCQADARSLLVIVVQVLFLVRHNSIWVRSPVLQVNAPF
jgi:hypothetical protein